MTPSECTPEDFALVHGGPLFRLAQRFHLEDPRRPARSGAEKILLAWAITWLPLFLLAALQGHVAGFLSDRPLQTGLIFTLPILLAGENYVNGRIAWAARQPLLLGLLPDAEVPRYRATLARAAIWRDSNLAELTLLLLAYGWTLAKFELHLEVPAFTLSRGELSLAGQWYAAVSYPLFAFVLLRWGWRFLLWAEVLLQLARLDLRLVASHADRTGGLRYLAITQASFSVVVFALGCVVSTFTRRNLPTLSGTGLLAYTHDQFVYTALSLAVLNLPLIAFVPKLLATKRDADTRFSALMARHGRDFERRWFGTPLRDEPLGSEDFSSQIDLSSSWDWTARMRWFPCGLRPFVAVVVSGAFLPLIPQLLADPQLRQALLELMAKLV